MKVRDIDELSFDELKKLYLSERKHNLNKISDLQDNINTLNSDIDNLNSNINDLNINITDLELQLKVANAKYMQVVNAKYQSQKNQIVLDMPTLFNDCEEEAMKIEEAENEDVIIIDGYQRKSKKPKEKHIDYSHLERRYVTDEPSQEDKICPNCGGAMKIKKYEEEEQLIFVPAKVFVQVTRKPVMECVACQEINKEGMSTYKKVSHSNKLFPRSMVSPSLLGYIIDMKYNRGLPLYTLEKMFAQENAAIPRANMANWIIGSMKYLEPLYNLMKEDLLSQEVVIADETRTQVLREEGKPATSTSYMWVYRNVRKKGKNIVIYDYEPSRSGDHPREFLQGFNGVLVTDAYNGYRKVEEVTWCKCNIHALRKVKDAYKLLPNNKSRKTSDEAKAVAKYQKVFHEDNMIHENADKARLKGKRRTDYIQKLRQEKVRPLLEEFFVWLKTIEGANAGKYTMSKAIEYILNNQKELIEFTNHGDVPNSSQQCEQAIRPFVIIRNRCKFYVSPKGADVSAMIYSIVISAVENGIQPYSYFTYILEKLANMDLGDKEGLRELLPYSTTLPEYTKILSKKEIKRILKQNDME